MRSLRRYIHECCESHPRTFCRCQDVDKTETMKRYFAQCWRYLCLHLQGTILIDEQYQAMEWIARARAKCGNPALHEEIALIYNEFNDMSLRFEHCWNRIPIAWASEIVWRQRRKPSYLLPAKAPSVRIAFTRTLASRCLLESDELRGCGMDGLSNPVTSGVGDLN